MKWKINKWIVSVGILILIAIIIFIYPTNKNQEAYYLDYGASRILLNTETDDTLFTIESKLNYKGEELYLTADMPLEYTFSEDILFQDEFKFDRFLSSMLKTTESVLGKLQKKSSVKVKNMYCVLSAPWYVSRAKIVGIKSVWFPACIVDNIIP